MKYIVELEHGVWLADGEGDPPRACVFANARRFATREVAEQALNWARILSRRSFADAEIVAINEYPDDFPTAATREEPDEFDTERTDFPVCPHCGRKDAFWRDSIKDGDVKVMECEFCGLRYRRKAHVEVSFTTEKFEEEK